MGNTSDRDFTPAGEFPQNPEFYRRVLDFWPSPMIVVDPAGHVIYGNRAMRQLSGWTIEDGVGEHMLNSVHPDDVGWLTDAFLELAQAAQDESFEDSRPWSAVHFRMLTSDGRSIPVEVTGTGGMADPVVGGIIYDVRPAYTQNIHGRVLTDLAAGAPIDSVLTLVTEMIALPPLDLQAAVLEPNGDGSYRVIGATTPELESTLAAAHDPMPWTEPTLKPTLTLVSDFPGAVGEALDAAGYEDFWHIAPESANTYGSHRIIACCPTHHVPSAGSADRLARASELVGVVILRARADALLEHAATHDRLTKLPNREGFYRAMSELTAEPRPTAVLYIDLDGFKPINDAHGHPVGDQVLEVVGKRLQSVSRSTDLVARLGGDEFALVLKSRDDRPVDVKASMQVATRVLGTTAQPIEIDGLTLRVTASVGVVIDEHPDDIDALLAQADEAMYEAKRSGGDRAHVAQG